MREHNPTFSLLFYDWEPEPPARVFRAHAQEPGVVVADEGAVVAPGVVVILKE